MVVIGLGAAAIGFLVGRAVPHHRGMMAIQSCYAQQIRWRRRRQVSARCSL